MTKRELIDALENLPLPDDAEVVKATWDGNRDSLSYETIYDAEIKVPPIEEYLFDKPIIVV